MRIAEVTSLETVRLLWEDPTGIWAQKMASDLQEYSSEVGALVKSHMTAVW